MELKRVVVTGLGAVTPLGNTIPEFWKNIQKGVSGAAPITRFDISRIKTRVNFACEVHDFDITKFIDRKEARKIDLYAQFAIASAVEAVADSGIDKEKENLDRIGVVHGVGMCGVAAFESGIEEMYVEKEQNQDLKVSPFFITSIISNMGAGYISIMNGFRGPSLVTSSACASGANAIIDAVNLIRLGKADVMVCGGSEAAVSGSGVCGFSMMRALSTRNDSPETASRPMSGSRDGFVFGEGAGTMVLEEYEHAVARGARIYAEVAGWGLSSDAYHITAPEPEGKGAISAMTLALQDASMKPDDIDYINMHGTSTPLGDIAECKAIQNVFGEHAYRMSLSSTKSMTGHLLGAAGAVEGIISVLSVYDDVVPPTINHAEGDDDENIDYAMDFTFNKAKKKKVNVAMSNNFGFGGHNACIIFKKFEG